MEEERRKKSKNRIAKLETQMAKSISEAMTQAMEEFKASFKMRNLNIKFGQEAFIKDFELYEGRVARRFFELNLKFLKEEDDVEVGPSDVVVDPSFIELVFDPSEPTIKVFEPVREPKAVKSTPALSSVVPLEIEIYE